MEETIATTEPQPFLGEDWFDPLATAVRGRIRGFIEEMLEGKVIQGIGKVQSAIGSAIDQIGATPIADRAAKLAKQATAAGEKATWVVHDAAQKGWRPSCGHRRSGYRRRVQLSASTSRNSR
jgi:hypothetical protein